MLPNSTTLKRLQTCHKVSRWCGLQLNLVSLDGRTAKRTMSMRERAQLTNHGHHAFSRAHVLADQLGHDEVTLLHLAIGVLGEGVAAGVLYNLSVPLEDLKRELEAGLPAPGVPRSTARLTPFDEPLEILDEAGHPIPGTTTTPYTYDWTPSDEAFILRAKLEARELGTRFYGTEHLLLAILRDDTSVPAQLLLRRGVNFETARAEIVRVCGYRPG